METNGRKYENNVPGIEELIKLLSGIGLNDPDRKPAHDVAVRLLPHALGDKWNDLSGRQKELLIDASTERLWFACDTLRSSMGKNAEEAAREAIQREVSFLTANVRYSQ